MALDLSFFDSSSQLSSGADFLSTPHFDLAAVNKVHIIKMQICSNYSTAPKLFK